MMCSGTLVYGIGIPCEVTILHSDPITLQTADQYINMHGSMVMMICYLLGSNTVIT